MPSSLEKLDTGLVTFICGSTVAISGTAGYSGPWVGQNGVNRWRYFDINTAGQIVYPTGSTGERIVGVVQQPALNGNAAQCLLMNNGISLVEAGAAIAIGDSVASDSTGRATHGATNASSGGGVALGAAAAAGVVIPVVLSGNAGTVA